MKQLSKVLGDAIVGVSSEFDRLVFQGMIRPVMCPEGAMSFFRRRVTTDRETVGGPIDVAVITKGEGFVWVKRKHYFSPEYNPRVVARYQQGG